MTRGGFLSLSSEDLFLYVVDFSILFQDLVLKIAEFAQGSPFLLEQECLYFLAHVHGKSLLLAKMISRERRERPLDLTPSEKLSHVSLWRVHAQCALSPRARLRAMGPLTKTEKADGVVRRHRRSFLVETQTIASRKQSREK